MIKESSKDIKMLDTRTTVDAGDYYFKVLNEGHTLRIVDLQGNQAADTLFYAADDPSIHYSASNSVRAQKSLYLTAGSALMGNDNEVLLDIVADTCGRHDTLGGACSTESNTVRYDLEKRCMHACRDSWMLAIAEHPEFGVSKRNISHNINFFMNVPVTPSGELTFEDGISAPGKYVEMTARRDVIVLISNCPQLNNPCCGYNPTPIELLTWKP